MIAEQVYNFILIALDTTFQMKFIAWFRNRFLEHYINRFWELLPDEIRRIEEEWRGNVDRCVLQKT